VGGGASSELVSETWTETMSGWLGIARRIVFISSLRLFPNGFTHFKSLVDLYRDEHVTSNV
jgi:hypothetical protein